MAIFRFLYTISINILRRKSWMSFVYLPMISATCLDEKARLGAEHNFVHLPLSAVFGGDGEVRKLLVVAQTI